MRHIRTEELADIASRPRGSVRQYVGAINETMAQYEIDTLLRQAHFLAQIIHESGSLHYMEEIWNPDQVPAQRRYDIRTDLGNTPERDGDGYRYRGRGVIQLTGRGNYRRYNETTELDVVAEPHLVAEPPLCMDVAGWYWDQYGLNRWADRDDVITITEKINGGHNGLAHRSDLLDRAKRILRGRPSDMPVEPPHDL